MMHADHPTVQKVLKRSSMKANTAAPEILDARWLRELCRELGADDVGFVEIDCPALAEERGHILEVFPKARTLVSLVVRMNRKISGPPPAPSPTLNSTMPAIRSTKPSGTWSPGSKGEAFGP